MAHTFNVIDVETANADRASICQIGIIFVENGEIVDKWQSLVNPNAWFDPYNVFIHGISANDVRNEPSFTDIREKLDRLNDSILISHSSFDRVALERASANHNLESLPVSWLDSAAIVKRAWPEKFGKKGWGLKNVAKNLGISFNHHDALEDARATTEIVLKACEATDTQISDWLHLVNRPVFPRSKTSARDRSVDAKSLANPDGPLFGETILFTGKLSVLNRKEAEELAAQVGCTPASNPSKKVTMLVVGIQDQSKLNGYEKSTKHRKIEEFIKKGFSIDILSESDFYELVDVKKDDEASKNNVASSRKNESKIKTEVGIEIEFGFEFNDQQFDEEPYEVLLYDNADESLGEIITHVVNAASYLNNLDGCDMDDPIFLNKVLDSNNERISVKVLCKEKQIGYLPDDLAEALEDFLDAGAAYSAFLEDDWDDIDKDDVDENNVGLTISMNLDEMPKELLKIGTSAEVPSGKDLENLTRVC